MSSRLTMIAGTPSYVAPEQAKAESLDARADQYSLAALPTCCSPAGRPTRTPRCPPPPNPARCRRVSTPERPVPAGRRGGAAPRAGGNRDDRWPDRHGVRRRAGRGPRSGRRGPTPQPWLAARPRAHPARPAAHRAARLGRAARAGPPRRRGRRLAVLRSSGWSPSRRRGRRATPPQRELAPTERTVTDDSGALSVTVPADWDRAVATTGWEPPNGDDRTTRRCRSALRETGPTQDPTAKASSWRCCPAPTCPSRCRSTPSARPRAHGPGHSRRRRLDHGDLLGLPGRRAHRRAGRAGHRQHRCCGSRSGPRTGPRPTGSSTSVATYGL